MTDLGGSTRSQVRRITLPGGATAVHKAYRSPGEGWVREAAALSVVGTPALLDETADPASVTMADVGSGPDLASVLLGHDPSAATAAVVGWAEAMADLAAATAGRRAEFVAQLAARSGDLPIAAETVTTSMADAGVVLSRYAAEWGLGAAPTIAGPEAGPAALTPGDCCPDNALLAAGGVVLIDYEAAQWRPVAWDVAYLTVPWPTCWCSWLLPPNVTAGAVEAYRTRLAPVLPEVGADAFDGALLAARDAWALWSAAHFLPAALDGDPTEGPRPTPTRRAGILHRLADAAERSPFAAALHEELCRRWGEHPLALAPAYR